MKKILSLFFAFIFCFALLVPSFAASSSTGSDLTMQYEDLSKTTIEYDFEMVLAGQYKTSDYLYNPEDKDLHYITAVETFRYFNQSGDYSYGSSILYIYVYNPSRQKIVKNSPYNTINYAFNHTNIDNFKKVNLTLHQTYSAASEDAETTDALILKYSVDSNNGAMDGKRVHRLGDFEILFSGQSLPNSYLAGKKLTFNGTNYNFTTCEIEDVITSEVFHTYYRVKSVGNIGNYNDIRSVYFPVPNEYLEKYGVMDYVKANWNIYSSGNMIITDSQEVADNLDDYLGDRDFTGDYSLLYEKLYPPKLETYEAVYLNVYNFDKEKFKSYINGWDYAVEVLFPLTNYSQILTQVAYNCRPYKFAGDKALANILGVYESTSNNPISMVYKVDGSKVNLSNPGSVAVPAEDLVKYFETNKHLFKLEEENKNVMFHIYTDTSSVDSGYVSSNFKTWRNHLSSWCEFDEKFEYSNFVQIDKDEISKMNDADVSKNYLINTNDVPEFRKNLNLEQYSNCTWFMLRYDITPYYTSEAECINHTTGSIVGDSIVARSSVVENFDIIETAFNKDGVLSIFAMGVKPTNAATDITTPEPPPTKKPGGDNEIWETIKRILIIILICTIVLVSVTIYLKYFRTHRVKINYAAPPPDFNDRSKKGRK